MLFKALGSYFSVGLQSQREAPSQPSNQHLDMIVSLNYKVDQHP